MSDSKKERPAYNGALNAPLQPMPSGKKKPPILVGTITLLLLAAITVAVYLLQSGLAQSYAGIGVALCVVTCGLFLVRSVIRLMKAEDQMQEQQANGEADSTTLSEPNPGIREINGTLPSEEPGQGHKKL